MRAPKLRLEAVGEVLSVGSRVEHHQRRVDVPLLQGGDYSASVIARSIVTLTSGGTSRTRISSTKIA